MRSQRPDHVRIGESIANLPTVTLGFDEAGGPQDREVLRDVRLARADLDRETPDFHGSIGEPMENFQASWAGEDLQDLCLQDRDFVHGQSIVHMRMCA